MSSTEKSIHELTESDLKDLEATRAPEGLMLEFKRELDLASNTQKKEAAKDASALANTAGGRIFYGIDETKLADKSVVAGPVKPITDGTSAARLSDVLNTTIHPRLRHDTQQIPVSGGIVLALEVYPSSQLDLHMVTGYADNRFYRRGPSGTVPMTEPEVREAYYRIAETRASLEARVRCLAEPELKLREQVDESILVLPLFSKPALVDPRQVGSLSSRLTTLLGTSDLQGVVHKLSLRYDGYRLLAGGDSPTESNLYMSILKTGVVHLSLNDAFRPKGDECDYWSGRSCVRILETLLVADEVLSLGNYWGPVRVLYRLRSTKPWRLNPSQFNYFEKPAIAAGTYDGEASDVNLRRTKGQWQDILREVLDPIFHAAGLDGLPVNAEGAMQVLKGLRRDFSHLTSVARVAFELT